MEGMPGIGSLLGGGKRQAAHCDRSLWLKQGLLHSPHAEAMHVHHEWNGQVGSRVGIMPCQETARPWPRSPQGWAQKSPTAANVRPWAAAKDVPRQGQMNALGSNRSKVLWARVAR